MSNCFIFYGTFFLTTALPAGVDDQLEHNITHYLAVGSQAISIKPHWCIKSQMLITFLQKDNTFS